MTASFYNIPQDVEALFEGGEAAYRIIDFGKHMEMDDAEALSYFLEKLEVAEENVVERYQHEVILRSGSWSFRMHVKCVNDGNGFTHNYHVNYHETEANMQPGLDDF